VLGFVLQLQFRAVRFSSAEDIDDILKMPVSSISLNPHSSAHWVQSQISTLAPRPSSANYWNMPAIDIPYLLHSLIPQYQGPELLQTSCTTKNSKASASSISDSISSMQDTFASHQNLG